MKKRILVIDDDDAILDAFEIGLTDAGYHVKTNRKNGEIYENIKKYAPDLIILDVLLSGMDGRDVSIQLKKQKRTKHIPIIMVSAHPDAKRTSLESGADYFLEKPFDMLNLLAIVKKYTHASNRRN